MSDDNRQPPQGDDPWKSPEGDEPICAERRSLLRAASALAAGAALFDPAQAQQAGGTPSAAAPLSIPGFAPARIDVGGGVTINAAKGGSGPPLLLLHGAPLTLYTWRDVAPQLAEDFTVVAADLRGYGDSSKPQGAADHSNYSKRAMASDQVAVMQHFGFDRFAVVGQDRGGRVTHRMALDHADKVTKAVLIDIVPTYYLYTHVNIDFVQAYFHWFNYLRAAPAPENELLAAQAGRQVSGAQAEYQRANGTPEGVHGMCEDYRAGASIDLQHDAADLDSKIRCPLHVLWAENGAMDKLYDVLAIWRERARTVTGKGMPGGHNMQEGAPAEVLAELRTYLGA
ncbi:MAG TPA: alpha/beta hydrolase [Gammaproteobacteria bacterium]|nr:alpha/beta hydrolase [Gammaproteobacteria bacterium]